MNTLALLPSIAAPDAAPANARPARHANGSWKMELAPRWVALLLTLWCTLMLNAPLWSKLAQLPDFVDPWFWKRAAIVGLIACATYWWFMLLSWPGVRRVGWSLTLLTAAGMEYYIQHYGILLDSGMVRNVLQTNTSEALALLGPRIALHILVFGGLPSVWLWFGVAWRRDALWRGGWRSLLLVLASFALLAAGVAGMYRQLAPLLRNHMELRYLINPTSGIVALADVTLKPLLMPARPFVSILGGAGLGASYGAAQATGGPASIQPASLAVGTSTHKPPLLVLVVGETARGDHFGMNGYARDTTPNMRALNAISWSNVRSCGTNTAASVPCMFSHLGKKEFEARKANHETLLDVVQAAGLGVTWLDNQSGCKGVCDRVAHATAYDQASAAQRAKWCEADGECLDQLMLEQLDMSLAKIPAQKRAVGTVLALHQMGSHGPAYFRRSTAQAKHFRPECTTQVTSDCSQQDLINVYDNSIAETDLFLAKTVEWLKTKAADYEVAMVYLSDHGESLGENGIYLHGLPYAIAPDSQKHVAWITWPGTLAARTRTNEACLRAGTAQPLTHDFYYHTVLGLLDVRSPTYRSAFDAYAPCRQALVSRAPGAPDTL
ncbi:sulfatase-like hydrolase/transferase [Acidovorax sp. CCYZU-2555]|uniref:phosphoethanolamine transferase n=1 Tax=Acidovorax sp. CCYZU-2555 TaxID=2835042 RepID=UPI0032DE8511